MCTVTYIPETNGRGAILTSNRDEKAYRPTRPPQEYPAGEVNLYFPKDEKAGGSWIAVTDNGRLCCLLNGAFTPHSKQEFHTRSRGTVLTGFASTTLPVEEYFEQENLQAVEPFTVVVLEQEEGKTTGLYEFVWDGNKKHVKLPNLEKPAIWSSVTLYSPENRNLRQEWFNDFLSQNEGAITLEKVLTFHSGKHTSDNSVNLVMERGGGLKTVSITQVTVQHKGFMMRYFDLNRSTGNETKLWIKNKNILVLP
ncbi:MAG: NRDE family protein [Mariniphaga sp.]|nr:NRDE family protein [Mariniphaga sp.]